MQLTNGWMTPNEKFFITLAFVALMVKFLGLFGLLFLLFLIRFPKSNS
jgi:hypothetical protein